MRKTNPTQKYAVFFDFDNTLTTFDMLDDMISRFSKDTRWMQLERDWKQGKIGSRECLKGQVSGIRIDKKSLDRYLSTVKIDPYFKILLRFLRAKKINTMILSDGFGYMIKRVLKNNDVEPIDVYSNEIKLVKNRMTPFFPFAKEGCEKCAHCKATSLSKKADKGLTSIYIGDGHSDICASKKADIVYAKGDLKKYLEDRRIAHIPFKKMKDVYNSLRRKIL